MIKKKSLKLAAIGDLHCTKSSQGKLQALFQQVTQSGADILLLCGDLVDYGQLDEAAVLAKELAPIRIPMLGVFGNHEYESGQQEEVRRILAEAGVTILDGDAIEVLGIGFVGAKRFGGGFASSMPPKLLSKQLPLWKISIAATWHSSTINCGGCYRVDLIGTRSRSMTPRATKC